MERPAWAPPGIDISVPSVSRMYDYYLGGSHNFEVDREAARKVLEFMPGLPKAMQANRAFMRRVVNYAVAHGVTQFLDIGSGIPTFGNVHEVARNASKDARVVYVDHDPVAVAHGQAVLGDDPQAAVVAADLRRPQQILESPEVAAVLDLSQPVALLLLAVLHFVEDEEDPYTAVRRLRDATVPGSIVAVTHMSYDTVPVPREKAEGVVGVYRGTRSPLISRSREQIADFFEGYEMVEPGLVSMPQWRPDAPTEQEDPYAFAGFAGVGRRA
ncbi:SAM-dependent methyltransferase [Streptomyces sp. NPDC005963]|uniref:SAM-dependent methyltransferase n=1 Tax=Streptomyces sp. NPDC005963 TaxID=3156721 RepID=UPI0033D06C74